MRRIMLLLALALCSSAATSAEQPNILLILTDDQAYDAARCLGWDEVDTPNIDRLAERGTTFTHAYNPGSWSGAVCVASRTMLFTGQQLWHAQRDASKLEQRYVETEQSWPQRLRAAGYRTAMTGKWHVQADPQKVFDQVRHVRPGMPNDHKWMYNRPHQDQPDPFDPSDQSAGGHWKGGRHWSEVVADDAIELMQPVAGDERPFFLYAAFNAPHDPRQAPAEYVARYPREKMSVPESFQPEYPYAEAMGAGRGLRDERLAPFPRTEYAVRAHRAEYAAIVSHLDAQIGRILDAVDQLGLTASTRIIFTSDHGLAIGRHGLLGKQNMYDHSVRVPFILSGPGLPTGQQITTPIYLQDVVPTTLTWAGASTDGIEFQDLNPLLDPDVTATPRQAIYGAYLDRQRMVTQDGWKLIVYPKVPCVRLYNLEKDPHEVVDLSENGEYKVVAAQLLDQLRLQQTETGDDLYLPAIEALQPYASPTSPLPPVR
ncbi:sulfatase-like hydrolase/transferase [Aeoliella sp. ICT_H6.2]|uniref:Sulfatase-like hydrolase/transferase n=1 Tax=Aeoliella straminimaris TaxID=2954799 RepID=A0A9X2FHJ2_9BACT|nr:sulfatase-like hydrolase/transferase [Aeoliella straminimaris]MCO6044986.1 sulfatase-like hydrolase/transferase [Aeoliella straminimaris]